MLFRSKSDKNGEFTFIANEKLKDGIYKLWAEAVDGRGARSKPTEKETIVVKQIAILKIGARAVTILTIVIPLVALIILLIAVVWYGLHKFYIFKSRIRKEAREAERTLHKEFSLLKRNIRSQIRLLEKTKSKRELTKEENKAVKDLKDSLDNVEGIVGKEIKDIEKEVK